MLPYRGPPLVLPHPPLPHHPPSLCASLCCHFLSASFLHLLYFNPPGFLFCSASPLPSLVFSVHLNLLDSIFTLSVCLFPSTLSLWLLLFQLLFREMFHYKASKISVCCLGHSYPLGPLSFPPVSFFPCVSLSWWIFAPYFPCLSPLMNFGHFAATDGAAGSRWRQGPGLTKRKGKGGEKSAAAIDCLPSPLLKSIETNTSLNVPSPKPHFLQCVIEILTYTLQPDSQCDHWHHLLSFNGFFVFFALFSATLSPTIPFLFFSQALWLIAKPCLFVFFASLKPSLRARQTTLCVSPHLFNQRHTLFSPQFSHLA